MDGVRAYWDGQKLFSRQGKELPASRDFTLGLPTGISLDGELWMGRGTHDRLSSLLKSNHQDWSDVQYCVFDLPSSTLPYKDRMKLLKEIELPPQVVQWKFH